MAAADASKKTAKFYAAGEDGRAVGVTAASQLTRTPRAPPQAWAAARTVRTRGAARRSSEVLQCAVDICRAVRLGAVLAARCRTAARLRVSERRVQAAGSPLAWRSCKELRSMRTKRFWQDSSIYAAAIFVSILRRRCSVQLPPQGQQERCSRVAAGRSQSSSQATAWGLALLTLSQLIWGCWSSRSVSAIVCLCGEGTVVPSRRAAPAEPIPARLPARCRGCAQAPGSPRDPPPHQAAGEHHPRHRAHPAGGPLQGQGAAQPGGPAAWPAAAQAPRPRVAGRDRIPTASPPPPNTRPPAARGLPGPAALRPAAGDRPLQAQRRAAAAREPGLRHRHLHQGVRRL